MEKINKLEIQTDLPRPAGGINQSRSLGKTNALHKIESHTNIRGMNRSELKQLTKDQLIDLLSQKNTKPRTTSRYSLGNPILNVIRGQDSAAEIRQLTQTKLRQLSENCYDVARKLGYKWNDLVTKSTPQSVINDVLKHKENIDILVREHSLRQKRGEIHREHTKIKKPYTKPKQAPVLRTKIEQTKNALRGYTKSYQVNIKHDKDPLVQLQNTCKGIETHFKGVLLTMQFKSLETLMITFYKLLGPKMIQKTAYFNSKPQTIINDTEIAEALQISQQQILNLAAQWVSEGSGWMIKSVDNHYLNIANYKPIKGSSYIQLPTELRNSAKGLINIKNEDNECFRWSHIRHLNQQDKDPQRIKKSDQQYIQKLDYKGIEFPVGIQQVNKIEKRNRININVFGYEDKQPYPIFISKEKFEDHMDLLLITKDENKHYVPIKDFDKFMYNQTKHRERKHFCRYCLQCFNPEKVLTKHKDNCLQINGTQAIKMPSKDDNILKFNNFHKQLPVPFVIYADFESLLEKVHGCQPSDSKSYTEAYQKHIDSGHGYKVVCCDDKYTKPVQIYRGENAVYKFMEAMLEEVKYCRKTIKKYFNKPLRMTENDEEEFQKADECHICQQKYTDEDIKVRDHCHISGNYRGSAHQDCNLNFQLTENIPIIFHNLRGYDSHFIMQNIGEIARKHTFKNKRGEEKQMDINVIPNSMEKYMAFMLGQNLVFIDSFQFMSQSLSNLVKNLPSGAFKYTSQEFQGEKLSLMKQKGVYPYDLMDLFDKFTKTELPGKEDFFSILNNEHITDEEYQHAQEVSNTFGFKSMGEYHDLYLKSDVLLLADVFENFRLTCLQYYESDPCHYFSSPGLSWDAMLKMTDIKLELMTDIGMF